MRNDATEERKKSMPWYEALEEWVRMQVQEFIQGILEEEVEALLGRSSTSKVDRWSGWL